MKLIATGKNGYLNADYIIGITVVEQSSQFVVKVDFLGGANFGLAIATVIIHFSRRL